MNGLQITNILDVIGQIAYLLFDQFYRSVICFS